MSNENESDRQITNENESDRQVMNKNESDKQVTRTVSFLPEPLSFNATILKKVYVN